MAISIPQTKAGFDAVVRSKIASMKQSLNIGADAIAELYSRDIVRFVEMISTIRPWYLAGVTPSDYIKSACDR